MSTGEGGDDCLLGLRRLFSCIWPSFGSEDAVDGARGGSRRAGGRRSKTARPRLQPRSKMDKQQLAQAQTQLDSMQRAGFLPYDVAIARSLDSLVRLENVRAEEAASFTVDILLVTGSELVLQAVLQLLRYLPRRKAVQCVQRDASSYYLGVLGQYSIAAVLAADEAAVAVEAMTWHWNAKAVIVVDLAYAAHSSQSLGDVLVSTSLKPFEVARSDGDGVYHVAHDADDVVPAGSVLRDAIANGGTDQWSFPVGPRVHHGPLASGVVRDHAIEDASWIPVVLEHCSNAIGVDVQPTGLAGVASRQAAEWMVVSGVCDHGRDQWQNLDVYPFAAEAAASLVQHILARPVLSSVSPPSPTPLQVLSFAPMLQEHRRRFAGRVDLINAVMTARHSGASTSVVAVVGMAGIGKTALAAELVGNPVHAGAVLAYHFCQARRADSLDAVLFVQSVAGRVCHSLRARGFHVSVPQQVLGLAAGDMRITVGAALSSMFRMLETLPTQPEDTLYILVDGLDVATADSTCLIPDLLMSLQRFLPSWIKLLVTADPSRAGVTDGLTALRATCIDVIVDECKADTVAWVRARMRRASKLTEYEEGEEPVLRMLLKGQGSSSSAAIDEISALVASLSQGNPLYASLALAPWNIEHLAAEAGGASFLISALQMMPQGLQTLYGALLQRKWYVPQRHAGAVLSVLLAARDRIPVDLLQDFVPDVNVEEVLDGLSGLVVVTVQVVSLQRTRLAALTALEQRHEYFLVGEGSSAFGDGSTAGGSSSYGTRATRKSSAGSRRRSNGGLASAGGRAHRSSLDTGGGGGGETDDDMEHAEVRLVWIEHDSVVDAVRDLCDLPAAHRRIARYGIAVHSDTESVLPDYLIDHLPYHLHRAGMTHRLDDLLRDLFWMQLKVLPVLRPGFLVAGETGHVADVNALTSDYRLSPNPEVRRCRLVLQHASTVLRRHPRSLPFLLLTHLSDQEASTRLLRLLSHARGSVRRAARRSPALCAKACIPVNEALEVTLYGHDLPVTGVAVLSATSIVSASVDRTARIWNLRIGEVVCLLLGHTEAVTCVAAIDAATVMTGSADATVRVWDGMTGDCVLVLKAHLGPVTAVAVIDDDNVVSASRDHTLIIWNLEDAAPVHTLRGHTSWVYGVAALAGGQRIVSGGADYTLRIWVVDTGACVQVVDRTSELMCVTRLHSGPLAVDASQDATVRVWNCDTGRSEAVMSGHTDCVNSVAAIVVLPDPGRHVAAEQQLEDPGNQPVLGRLRSNTVGSLGGRRTTERVVSGARDCTIRVWDPATGIGQNVLFGHTDSVTAVGGLPWNDDIGSSLVVSGSLDHSVRLWRPASPSTRPVHTAAVTCVAAFGGEFAVSGSADTVVRTWRHATTDPARVLAGHEAAVSCVGVLDSRTIVSGGAGDGIRVWDGNKGRFLRRFDHGANVHCLVVLGEDRIAAASGRRGGLAVWMCSTGTPVRQLVGHLKPVLHLATLGEHRTHLVSGGRDKELRVWDIAGGGECVRVLRGHTGSIRAIVELPAEERSVGSAAGSTTTGTTAGAMSAATTLSTTGSAPRLTRLPLIASAADDGVIRIWDAEKSTCVRELRRHHRPVYALVLMPSDPRYILSASSDGTLRMWRWSSARSVQTMRLPHLPSCIAVHQDARRVLCGFPNGHLATFDVVLPGEVGDTTSSQGGWLRTQNSGVVSSRATILTGPRGHGSRL